MFEIVNYHDLVDQNYILIQSMDCKYVDNFIKNYEMCIS